MKRAMVILAVVAFWTAGTLPADYGVQDKGTWPKGWPKELEPLRKQARTFEGNLVLNLHYAIPFTKREELEAAWPTS